MQSIDAPVSKVTGKASCQFLGKHQLLEEKDRGTNYNQRERDKNNNSVTDTDINRSREVEAPDFRLCVSKIHSSMTFRRYARCDKSRVGE